MATAARAELDAAMSEKEFQQQVVDFARLKGWRVFHAFDSRRSAAGFPDLVLVRNGHLAFLELKTSKGRITAEQEQWIDDLNEVPAIDARVLRPQHWTEIEELLR